MIFQKGSFIYGRYWLMLHKIDTSWSRLGQSTRPVKGLATVLVLVPQLVCFLVINQPAGRVVQGEDSKSSCAKFPAAKVGLMLCHSMVMLQYIHTYIYICMHACIPLSCLSFYFIRVLLHRWGAPIYVIITRNMFE